MRLPGPGHPPVDLRDPGPALEVARARRAQWVALHGSDEPDAVLAGVRAARAAGLRALWLAGPHADESLVRRAVGEGLEALAVAATDADDPGIALLRATAGVNGLRRVVQVALHARTAPRLATLGGTAADLRATVEVYAGQIPLRPDPPGPPLPRAAALDALDALAATGASWRAWGLELAPSPTAVPGVAPRLTVPRVTAVRDGLPLPSHDGGLRLDADALRRCGDPLQVGRMLGASGVPVHELPVCAGGLGRGEGPRCDACPGGSACGGMPDALGAPTVPAPWAGVGRGARVLIVIPFVPDRILVGATLPGLAERLAALGADVRLHSAWHRPFDPLGPPPVPALDAGDDARHERVRRAEAAFLRAFDPDGADVVVVPGFAWADVVRRHPAFPAGARLVVADLHLQEGVDRWRGRDVTAWASVHVHSCFPGYARLLERSGVPLGQVSWRPYPVHLPCMPAGPDPADCRDVVAAGSHLRDHATLAAAVAGPGPIVDVIGAEPPPRVPRLRHVPPLPLPDLYDRLARARYVVVAVRHAADRAAGISILALARAAGRPVIASLTPGTRDHVTHGVDGLLVPCGDASALAAAMARLDADDDLVRRLGTAARAASEAADTAAWARALLDGDPRGVVPDRGTGGAPWRAW